MNWIEIGHLDDIPVLGSRVVESAMGDIAIFRNTENKIFALKDSCPHKGGPLSQGIVYETKVTCPLHNFVIDLESGKALPPDEGCANRFDTKVEDGKIFLAI